MVSDPQGNWMRNRCARTVLSCDVPKLRWIGGVRPASREATKNLAALFGNVILDKGYNPLFQRNSGLFGHSFCHCERSVVELYR